MKWPKYVLRERRSIIVYSHLSGSVLFWWFCLNISMFSDPRQLAPHFWVHKTSSLLPKGGSPRTFEKCDVRWRLHFSMLNGDGGITQHLKFAGPVGSPATENVCPPKFLVLSDPPPPRATQYLKFVRVTSKFWHPLFEHWPSLNRTRHTLLSIPCSWYASCHLTSQHFWGNFGPIHTINSQNGATQAE